MTLTENPNLSRVHTMTESAQTKNLGQIIKHHRNQRGISQRQLADALGHKTRDKLAKWETGHGRPGVTECPKLADALGLDPETLLQRRAWEVIESQFPLEVQHLRRTLDPTQSPLETHEMDLIQRLRSAEKARPELNLSEEVARLLKYYQTSLDPIIQSAQLLNRLPAQAREELTQAWHHMLRAFFRANNVAIEPVEHTKESESSEDQGFFFEEGEHDMRAP